jgi:hypothetical protein
LQTGIKRGEASRNVSTERSITESGKMIKKKDKESTTIPKINGPTKESGEAT